MTTKKASLRNLKFEAMQNKLYARPENFKSKLKNFKPRKEHKTVQNIRSWLEVFQCRISWLGNWRVELSWLGIWQVALDGQRPSLIKD